MSSLKEKLLFDERIKYKNVLALNEKIQAIRCYESNPVYKKVGRIFNCSPDQIKRIVNHKERYLSEWENRTRKPIAPSPLQIKTVSISILGKAVHEWIRRIMYYTDFYLNDTLIKTMAMEFAKVLNLTRFTPTKEWIAQFRATYKLPDANTKTMNIGYQESLSVQILDILRYVKSVCENKPVEVEEGSRKRPAKSISPKYDSDNEKTTTVVKMEDNDEENDLISDIIKTEEEEICQPSCSSRVRMSQEVSLEKTNQQQRDTDAQSSAANNFDFEIKEEFEDESEAPTDPTSEQEITPDLENGDATEMLMEIDVKPEPDGAESEADPDTIVINTKEGAMNCVKLLEEFALLKENFRLIGLIERLEEALNEKP